MTSTGEQERPLLPGSERLMHLKTYAANQTQRARQAIAERDEAILALRDEGLAPRVIGAITGINHRHIDRIVVRAQQRRLRQE